MKKKTRLIPVLLAGAMLASSLAGCSGGAADTPADPTPAPAVTEPATPVPENPEPELNVKPALDGNTVVGAVSTQGAPSGDTGSGSTGDTGDDQPEAPKPVAGMPAESASNPWYFEDSLMAYLDSETDWAGRSYMVSPASLRAALCLAIEGAKGQTKAGLLKAAGFEDTAAMERWYGDLLDARLEFLDEYKRLKKESKEYGDGSDPGMSFDIANAIWDNADKEGGFRKEYIKSVEKKYGATASSSPKDRITADVNEWVSKKTDGMIQEISDDLSNSSAVLANALYLKSAWTEGFDEYDTQPGTFTRSDGSTLDVDLMTQVEEFLYHEDAAGRQYAMFGLKGGIWMTVCLDGDVKPQDMAGAMYNAEYKRLAVKMPKLDLETGFASSELDDYLISMGADNAFNNAGEFGAMTDLEGGWHIDDVIQKTRLKTDEDGLEAAAVTAVIMADNAMAQEAEAPLPFYMDHAFSFLITSGRYGQESGMEILFMGRYDG